MPACNALTLSCALKSITFEPRSTKPDAPVTWNACSQSESTAHTPRTTRPSKCQWSPETLNPSSASKRTVARPGFFAFTVMGACRVPLALHDQPWESYVPSARMIASPGCAAAIAAPSSVGVDTGTSFAKAARDTSSTDSVQTRLVPCRISPL
jgi:hypothetical protein